MTRSELKTLAKSQMKNNLGMMILAMIIYSLIIGGASAAFGLSIIIIGPMSIGLVTFFLTIIRTGKADLEKLFNGFSDNIGRNIIYGILNTIYIILWTLLFYIPGIIKSYSYALAPLILEKDKNISGNDAITKSRELMDGHKWDLFVLDLSFILWILLCIVTFGLASFYVMPYMTTTRYNFLSQLLPEEKNKDVIDLDSTTEETKF